MKHDSRIDIAKGILITLVIVGHVTEYHLIQRNLYTDKFLSGLPLPDLIWIALRLFLDLVVPAFIFLSGYVLTLGYRAYDSFPVASFYKQRLKRLYIPYIVWFVIYTFINGESSVRNIAFSLLFFDGNFHFWFIWVLFISYILFPFLLSAMKKYPVLLFALITISTLIAFSILSIQITRSYTINYIIHKKLLILPLNIGYFSIGIATALYSSQNIFKLTKSRYLVLLLISGISLGARFANFLNHNFILNRYLEMSVGILYILSGTLMLLGFIPVLQKRFERVCAFFSQMGLSSYGIYLSHMAIIYALRAMFTKLIVKSSTPFAMITMTGCIIILYFIVRYFKYSKIRSAFGI
jgi:fucose 4-O-acetylase-like acetyltransferase